jgi:hypothetical protein
VADTDPNLNLDRPPGGLPRSSPVVPAGAGAMHPDPGGWRLPATGGGEQPN